MLYVGWQGKGGRVIMNPSNWWDGEEFCGCWTKVQRYVGTW